MITDLIQTEVTGKTNPIPPDAFHYSSGVTGSNEKVLIFPAASRMADRNDILMQKRTTTNVGILDRSTIFQTFDEREKLLLQDAFDRITDANDRLLTAAARSNSFDEWKDNLLNISRKVLHLTNNHRKILGSLLVAIKSKDISDFNNDALSILMDATNTLRAPRLTKPESRKITEGLVRMKLKVALPLMIDNLGEEEMTDIETMMEELIKRAET